MRSALITSFLAAATLTNALPCSAQRQRPNRRKPRRPAMKPTKTLVFKTTTDAKGNAVKLKLHVFEPAGHTAADKRAAAVFFFGGGWTGGNPAQFYAHCKYLASRGMWAASAEYRVKSRHGTSAFECVADGKSAVRYIRANAAKLGVDPKRIASGGGSAGGHVGACTGTIPALEEKGEDTSISSAPNAMLLFNPATNTMWINRLGPRRKEISPVHHVRKGICPTFLTHGTNDTTVPFANAKAFAEAMTKAGNRCEFLAYEGGSHGFFNFGRDGNTPFIKTVTAADRFLTSLGFLKGKSTVEVWVKGLQNAEEE